METPRRWEELGNRLSHHLLTLAPRVKGLTLLQEPDWKELTRRLFAEELLCRPATDEIAKRLASHGPLPETPSPEVAYFLCLRIQCSLDFLGMVFPPQADSAPWEEMPQGWSPERSVQWLLVDLWLRRHDHWLKLVAIGLHGPFAFYGLDPRNPALAE